MDAVGRACARVVDTAWFQGAVVLAILANAVLLGLETYGMLGWLLFGSFLVLNLVIAIVLNSVEEAREEERRARRIARAAVAGTEVEGGLGHPVMIEERLRDLRDALDGLEAELARESGPAG